MKRILRHFVIDTYSLWLTSLCASGMVFGRGFITLLLAGVGVTLVSVIAKPVINLLLLPLNLLTFGVFRWVAAAIVLFLVTLLVKDFAISGFAFSGFSNKWIELPALNFHGILAFVGFSFILSIITSFIYWLIK
jgi:putative membrane protein